jgi:hypothetical protein
MFLGNPFYEITFVAIIFTILSVIREIYFNTRLIKQLPCNVKYVYNIFFRFIHYIIILTSAFFFIFFRGKWKTIFWMRFELALLFMILFGWWLFGCCWISYIEIMLYDVNVNLYNDSPCFFCLFNPFHIIVKILCVFLYLVNIYFIMLNRDVLPYWGKVIYILVFSVLFIKEAIIRNIIGRTGYPKNNPILNIIQSIFDKYRNILK